MIFIKFTRLIAKVEVLEKRYGKSRSYNGHGGRSRLVRAGSQCRSCASATTRVTMPKFGPVPRIGGIAAARTTVDDEFRGVMVLDGDSAGTRCPKPHRTLRVSV